MLPNSKNDLPQILLFEDEALLHLTMTGIFRGVAQLQGARSVEEGLKLIAAMDHADVGIFDGSLNKDHIVDTVPLYVAFKEKFPKALTVLMTSNTHAIDKFNLAGAPDELIQKPAPPLETREKIMTYIYGLRDAEAKATQNSEYANATITPDRAAAIAGHRKLTSLLNVPAIPTQSNDHGLD